ncbi:hypothetical protein GOBAR_AA01885 [Gossypium barbadense]|uniref:Uncharacterized protein n=1 Tax=Gossypium barbadense TaxID=3634 RepID=A0A2P5YSZ2_GOSBA|nr:hypothetical protein GOBAR_AA01885 [Gossypium barbadense]
MEENIETALKNQQGSIQGLKTQIGQLSKLIFERPQGSLLSNTEPNPREQLNAINVQDEEGFVEPEPKPWKETEISKGKGEVDHNEQKPEMSLKEVHEPFSRNSRGPIHEEPKPQIEELDEWRTHKLRTHDKPKQRQDELNTFPNQLKVADKVLLDVADPHIVTAKLNEETSYGLPCRLHDERKPLSLLQRKGRERHLPRTVMTNYNDPGTVQFRLGRLVRQLSVPEFGTALGLYMEEFKEENDLHALNRHIHRSLSKCWYALAPGAASYNPSHSKASDLPPSLRALCDVVGTILRAPRHRGPRIILDTHWLDVFTSYKELQSSLLLRDSKLHWERFSMTFMSYSTTTITNFKYNILLAQDLWTNEPLPPPEYPPPPQADYSPNLQFKEIHSSLRKKIPE